MGVGVVEPQGGIQPDGNPNAIPDPSQLPDLALSAWMRIKGLLKGTGRGKGGVQSQALG